MTKSFQHPQATASLSVDVIMANSGRASDHNDPGCDDAIFGGMDGCSSIEFANVRALGKRNLSNLAGSLKCPRSESRNEILAGANALDRAERRKLSLYRSANNEAESSQPSASPCE